MSTSFLTNSLDNLKNCFNCNDYITFETNFCGNCGSNVRIDSKPINSYYTLELHHEINNAIVLLLREKILYFAIMFIFLTINLLGIYMSIKCYAEFNGEDMTRAVMSFTPLFYINMTSLVCLQPLKKRKREILRLKEKLKALNLRISLENSLRA